MNLENLNLVELNAQEVQETEGGRIMWWWDWALNCGLNNYSYDTSYIV